MVRGEVIGGELGRDRAPTVGKASADHRDRREGASERAQQVRQQAREREADEHQRDCQMLAPLAGAARWREHGRADHADDDRERREVLVAPGALAQHALPEQQQHQQPGGECRLHHHQRGQQQRHHLQRPAEHRQPGAEQPAGPSQQPTHQRQAQMLLRRRLPRVQCLQGDP